MALNNTFVCMCVCYSFPAFPHSSFISPGVFQKAYVISMKHIRCEMPWYLSSTLNKSLPLTNIFSVWVFNVRKTVHGEECIEQVPTINNIHDMCVYKFLWVSLFRLKVDEWEEEIAWKGSSYSWKFDKSLFYVAVLVRRVLLIWIQILNAKGSHNVDLNVSF